MIFTRAKINALSVDVDRLLIHRIADIATVLCKERVAVEQGPGGWPEFLFILVMAGGKQAELMQHLERLFNTDPTTEITSC